MPDSHALVTGGSSGIGLATTAKLAARGATSSLASRRLDVLTRAAEQLRDLGGRVHIASADVSDQVALEQAIAELETQAGPVDVPVTSAGQARPGHFLQLDDDVFRQTMEVDYFGTL